MSEPTLKEIDAALDAADLPDDGANPVGSTKHERTLAAAFRAAERRSDRWQATCNELQARLNERDATIEQFDSEYRQLWKLMNVQDEQLKALLEWAAANVKETGVVDVDYGVRLFRNGTALAAMAAREDENE